MGLATDCVFTGVLHQDLDGPVTEHINLGQEGVVCNVGEEVPLAHVFWSNLCSEFVQEDLQSFRFIWCVPETP